MKLEHSKSWYEKNSEAEGASEVGAGVPPWWETHAGRSRRPAPAVMEIQPRGNRKPRPVHSRHASHIPAGALCHS